MVGNYYALVYNAPFFTSDCGICMTSWNAGLPTLGPYLTSLASSVSCPGPYLGRPILPSLGDGENPFESMCPYGLEADTFAHLGTQECYAFYQTRLICVHTIPQDQFYQSISSYLSLYSKVTSLILYGPSLNSDQVNELVEQIWDRPLVILDLQNHLLSTNTANKIAAFVIRCQTLVSLRLSGCNLTNDFFSQMLGTGCSNHRSIKYVDLSHNSMDRGARLFAEAGGFKTLQSIRLCNCSIAERTVLELVWTIRQNPGCVHADFTGNTISEAGKAMIKTILAGDLNRYFVENFIGLTPIQSEPVAPSQSSESSCKNDPKRQRKM